MKFCEHCGGKLENNPEFCPNCGAKIEKKASVKVNGEVVENNNGATTTVKDNTTTAFVCSIIGFLCCTYVAIPGLILSIMSLKDMNEGKISSEKKWMAIAGIVLSILGLAFMIYNIANPTRNEELIKKITEQFNLENEFIFK